MVIDFEPLAREAIKDAHSRIKPFIKRTPVMSSGILNQWLGHEVFFKAEILQTTGAFKIRGALNTLLALKEQGKLPKQVVAFSSGNHAQAVAYAANLLDVPATIFLPEFASKIKQQATASYGAKVINTKSRQEAEARTLELSGEGAYAIHPYDNDLVIAGQGTASFEALQDVVEPDAVFSPCGGGGLTCGTYLTVQLLSPKTQVFGCEPLIANDATRSYQTGNIVKLADTPKTIADGVRTLAVSERTFYYLKKLNGFIEATEDEIIYWTQWLSHLLKISVEPTSALAMACAYKWLAKQNTKQRILVLLSGGNIDPETQRLVWQNDWLQKVPSVPNN